MVNFSCNLYVYEVSIFLPTCCSRAAVHEAQRRCCPGNVVGLLRSSTIRISRSASRCVSKRSQRSTSSSLTNAASSSSHSGWLRRRDTGARCRYVDTDSFNRCRLYCCATVYRRTDDASLQRNSSQRSINASSWYSSNNGSSTWTFLATTQTYVCNHGEYQ